MYAQLCRRLNELVPNFEEPGSQSTTFRKLLLHKCQEEFENRRAASASFDGSDGLSSEEEEQRGVAKRKMLGNIRFVGELFKIGVLHEAIIHSCIKELLERRRGTNVTDMVENVECLCHFMTTVGEKLDTHRAKGWMDKYFKRIHSLTTNPDLPRRIHFMLLDVLELRANKWQPRRSSSQQGPRPLHEIRQEVYQQDKPTPSTLPPMHQPGFRGPPYAPQRGPPGDEGFVSAPSDSRHLFSPQESLPMVFPAQPYTPPPEVGVAKGVEPSKPAEKKPPRKLPKAKTDTTVSLRPSAGGLKPSSRKLSHGEGTAGESGGSMTSLGEGGGESGRGKVKTEQKQKLPRTRDDSSDEEDPQIRDTVPPHPPPPPGPVPPRAFVPGYPPHNIMMPPRDPFYPRGPIYPVTNVPPRPLMAAPPPVGMPRPPPVGQPHPPGPRYYGPPPPMRPPAPSYSGQRFRPPPPQGVQPGLVQPPGWATPPQERPHPSPETKESTLPPHLERNEPVKVKYVSTKSGKKGGASGKKAIKDENEKAVEPVISRFLKSRDLELAVTTVRELGGVPRDTLTTLLLTKTLDKSEDDRTRISELIKQLCSEELIDSAHFLQAVRKVLSLSVDYENTLPQYKTYLAGFIARAIAHEVIEFAAMATLFNLGAHHPTLLVVLQALTALMGEERVGEVVKECGVKLTSLLPVEYRSHEALSDLLESKKLIFLYPIRRIQLELTARLRQSDSTAVTLYKWIKANVDPAYYHTPEFVMVLTRCILEYVCSESTLATPINPTDHPSKTAVAKEEQLMEKFKVLIARFVSEDPQLQVSTLYATQTFCHQRDFPKGLLLRLFSHLYNMDVVEEESFLQWKEDLTQQFPGKGKALFQVNHWLVLLAEAESSEEET